jgi:hypothetical protein
VSRVILWCHRQSVLARLLAGLSLQPGLAVQGQFIRKLFVVGLYRSYKCLIWESDKNELFCIQTDSWEPLLLLQEFYAYSMYTEGTVKKCHNPRKLLISNTAQARTSKHNSRNTYYCVVNRKDVHLFVETKIASFQWKHQCSVMKEYSTASDASTCTEMTASGRAGAVLLLLAVMPCRLLPAVAAGSLAPCWNLLFFLGRVLKAVLGVCWEI